MRRSVGPVSPAGQYVDRALAWRPAEDLSGSDTRLSYSAEAYYPHEHGDYPLIVWTDDDVGALVDALLAESFDHSLANLYIAERPLNAAGMPDHEFGVAVDAERGVDGLWYMGAGGSWYGVGRCSDRDDVYYCYMGNDTDFPIDSEIPIDLVRQAAKEFLASGGERPACVTWQPHQA